MIIPLLSLAGGAMPWSGCSAYIRGANTDGSRLVVNGKMSAIELTYRYYVHWVINFG